VVVAHQPELAITTRGDSIVLTGPFVISGGDGPFDSYEVEVVIKAGFPAEEPVVFETGGRIPREIDRHIFPRTGACCVGVWGEWLFGPNELTIKIFLAVIMHDYFVSQTYFDLKGVWPFGERSHGLAGVIESYADLLGVQNNVAVVSSHFRLLSQKQIKGHARCPCGSGKRVRNCHKEELDILKQRLDPLDAKHMLKVIVGC
jgi:hypothetical protein